MLTFEGVKGCARVRWLGILVVGVDEGGGDIGA